MKRNNSSGVPITRASVWIQAHKKPNGEPVNELAKDTIEKIVEKNTSIAYGKDDAFAQVFGGEPDGRVRGVGYGMTKSTMYGVQQCMGVVSQMQGEYKLVLEELHTLRELVVQNGNHKANHILPPQRQADMNTEGKDSFDEETSEHMNMGTSSSSQLFAKDLQSQKSFPKKTKSKRNSGTTMSPQVQMDMNTHRQDDLDAEISEHVKDLPQQSGLKKKKFKNKSKKNSERVSSQVVHCKLFRMIPEDVVAEGYWYTDDPKISMHNVPLGLGYSKVSIEVAVKEDALLVRSNEEFKTIGDAVGSFVAWPTSSIIKE